MTPQECNPPVTASPGDDRVLVHAGSVLFAAPGGRALEEALTFRIGPDFDAAREFVYSLGPQRLDELLSAKVVSDSRFASPALR